MPVSTPAEFCEFDALGVEAGDIGYAALLARHAASEPVTDDMVRRAGLRRAFELSPAASSTDSPTDSSTDSSTDPSSRPSFAASAPSTGTLARLFRSRWRS